VVVNLDIESPEARNAAPDQFHPPRT